jgi:hypothetical protein
MHKCPDPFFNLDDCVPSLRKKLEESLLNVKRVWLAAVPIEDPEKHPKYVPAIKDRHLISLSDGKDFCHWDAEDLQKLFRGAKIK